MIEITYFPSAEEEKYGIEVNHIGEGENPYHTYYN